MELLLQPDTGIPLHVQDGWEAKNLLVSREADVGYHPCSTGFLTCARDRGGDNVRQELRLGRSPPKGIGGAQSLLRMVGNHPESAKAEGGGCDTDGGAGTKVGLSDPVA